MKKLLLVALALVTALSLVVPVMAAGAGTSVTVSQGGGMVPDVKCKWEQEPIPALESGDPMHKVAFSQFNPPMVKGAKKPIDYFAVVTDAEDMGRVSQVFADVFHPILSPSPYNNSKHTPIDGEDPAISKYFKYEVPFKLIGHSAAEIALVKAAYDAGLITFGNYTISEVIFELEKGTADLWMGEALIDYEQPGGLYTVRVHAVDTNNNLSAAVVNQFLYVPMNGVEIDFTTINFGPVNLGVEKMIAGDTIWVSPAAPAGYLESNQATIRNIGNVWAYPTVKFDDMGFGQDVTGKWNVQFDARMGNDNAYYEGDIMPFTTRQLRNALGLSKKDELDLSIKVIKGFGPHSGVVTVGSAPFYPFVDPVPANVVGFPDPS